MDKRRLLLFAPERNVARLFGSVGGGHNKAAEYQILNPPGGQGLERSAASCAAGRVPRTEMEPATEVSVRLRRLCVVCAEGPENGSH